MNPIQWLTNLIPHRNPEPTTSLKLNLDLTLRGPDSEVQHLGNRVAMAFINHREMNPLSDELIKDSVEASDDLSFDTKSLREIIAGVDPTVSRDESLSALQKELADTPSNFNRGIPDGLSSSEVHKEANRLIQIQKSKNAVFGTLVKIDEAENLLELGEFSNAIRKYNTASTNAHKHLGSEHLLTLSLDIFLPTLKKFGSNEGEIRESANSLLSVDSPIVNLNENGFQIRLLLPEVSLFDELKTHLLKVTESVEHLWVDQYGKFSDYGNRLSKYSVLNPHVKYGPRLYSGDGKFWGRVGAFRHGMENISNKYGKYGNLHDPQSLAYHIDGLGKGTSDELLNNEFIIVADKS